MSNSCQQKKSNARSVERAFDLVNIKFEELDIEILSELYSRIKAELERRKYKIPEDSADES